MVQIKHGTLALLGPLEQGLHAGVETHVLLPEKLNIESRVTDPEDCVFTNI